MNNKVRAVSAIVVLFFVLGALVAPVLSQGDESWLPAPTGPYQIGRTTRHWVDESREETYTDDEDDHRELMVRIWYPAEVGEDATPVPYIEDFSGPMADEVLAAVWGGALDSSEPAVQEFIQATTTHAFSDAPVSSEQSNYPVLVFSPGYMGLPEQYTIQIEELASHGYVVVGTNHPYLSGVTVFPDGRVVVADSRMDTWITAQDMIFVLDQLEVLNTDDSEGMFTGRLDLERIGAFGMSLGGAAAVRAGGLDSRFQAVISEDGGIEAFEPLEPPFMYFTTGPHSFPSFGLSYTVWCSDFVHLSFSDLPVWPDVFPDLSPDRFGTINGPRTIEIVRVYVLAFFDKHLKGQEVTLLNGLSLDYPEVETEILTPPQSVEDPTYPPGTTFTAASTLYLVTWPGLSTQAGGCRSETDATVLQVVEDADGVIWLELECDRYSGWVLERRLEE